MASPAPPLRPPGKIIVMNGFPGAGKLTILRKTKELLPPDTTRLIDNHLLIDPVAAVIPGRDDEHHELRRLVRAPILAKLAEYARQGFVILMTACLAAGNERDAAFFAELLAMVRGTDVPLVWVNVHCEKATLERRLRSPERLDGAKTKLTDPGVLQTLLCGHRLLEPIQGADGSTTLIVKTLDVNGPVDLSVSRLMAMIDPGQGHE